MNKTELLAALQSEDFDREALLATLSAEAEKSARYRERPSVREHIDQFNQDRKDVFQVAIYGKDPEVLADAVQTMVGHLLAIAEAAGVEVSQD